MVTNFIYRMEFRFYMQQLLLVTSAHPLSIQHVSLPTYLPQPAVMGSLVFGLVITMMAHTTGRSGAWLVKSQVPFLYQVIS